MLYLYIVLGFIAVSLTYMYFEAGFAKIEHIRFTKSSRCLKVLQISDIHINMLRVSQHKVRKIINRENPDIIVLTGDYINKGSHAPQFLNFIDNIKGECDIYACLGNHDYRVFLDDDKGLEDFIRQLEQKGIIMLQNESVIIEKHLKRYNLIGIGDIRYDKDDIEKALKHADSKTAVNVAFSHNPDVVLKLPRGGVDYLLCGHFHGGQIWAPFNLEFKMLRREKLCRMGIRRGLHKTNGINIYLNRGLGNVCVPLRFLSRPEVTILYIP